MYVSLSISIHAPLTGSDGKWCPSIHMPKISIHAPLTGSDKYGGCECFNECRFQSTLPSQGATFSSPSVQASQNISIHAPLTGSDLEHVVTYGGIWISIHAPLTGSDAYTFQTLRFGYNFNPRSPHRERLTAGGRKSHRDRISIHAPLTGSDGG